MTIQSPDWDVRKFESSIEKEVYNRKQLGTIASTTSASRANIFDQFFIFGVSPDCERKSTPTILAAFPPFSIPTLPLQKIIPLSFPNFDTTVPSSYDLPFTKSFTFAGLKSTPESKVRDRIIDEFVFQINTEPMKTYGLCVHVVPARSAIQDLPFYASKFTKKTIFCFCLLSKTPVFNSHFTFLHYLIGLSLGFVQPNDPCVEESPIHRLQSNEILFDSEQSCPFDNLLMSGLFGHHILILNGIPDDFQVEVQRYYQTSIYSTPKTLAEGFDLYFPPPLMSNAKCILSASLDCLLSNLSPSDIVDLISALMLDAQVIIVGSSLHQISMTVFALRYLLSPFNYCGAMMPVLPISDDFIELVNSPTPYIFGIFNSPKLKKMTFLDSTYLVNLDKHLVPSNTYYPKYPQSGQVVDTIVDLLNSVQDYLKKVPVQPNKQWSEASSSKKLETPRIPSLVADAEQTGESNSSENSNVEDPAGKKRKHRGTISAQQFQKEMESPSDSTESPPSITPQLRDSQTLHEFSRFSLPLSVTNFELDPNPYRFPDLFTRTLNQKIVIDNQNIDNLIKILNQPLSAVLTQTLTFYFVTNASENITIFNQELFLASVDQEDRQFYEFLLDSQTFQDYVEAKLAEFSMNKQNETGITRLSSYGKKVKPRKKTLCVKSKKMLL